MKRVAIALIRGPEDTLLMGQRLDNGKWSFPAGGCNKGETPEEAVIREVKEETGLDVITAKLVEAGIESETSIFMYLCTVDPTQNIDTSKDPDREFDHLTYEDPLERASQLHVPAHKNWALKWWSLN